MYISADVPSPNDSAGGSLINWLASSSLLTRPKVTMVIMSQIWVSCSYSSSESSSGKVSAYFFGFVSKSSLEVGFLV